MPLWKNEFVAIALCIGWPAATGFLYNCLCIIYHRQKVVQLNLDKGHFVTHELPI